MQSYRLHAGGRRPRRARLVDLSRRARPAIDGEDAQAFIVGLEAARLLKAHFPAFYAEHAAGMPCAPENLLGCAGAFWQLWQAEGLQLRMPGDDGWYGEELFELEATPAETLHNFSHVTTEFMNSSVAHFIMVPRPNYFGLGVESWLETEDGPDILTATLWRLFQGTHWSIIDMDDIHSGGYNDLEPEIAVEIASLRPLPSNVGLAALANRVKLPGVESTEVGAFDLLAYAVAQTGNSLADHNDYDAEAIHMGEVDEEWSWGQARVLIDHQREARAISKAYQEWSNWLYKNPSKGIREIAAALHKAHRASRAKKPKDDPTLITMLAEAGMLGEVSA